jgi:AraC-like DNA-binding protein
MYAATPTVRLVRFVEVLSLLADDNNYRFLCPPGQDEPKAQAEICPRINRTLEYIHEHYDTDISIDELANMAALSPSGLHRLFKRHTRLTVSEYIAQLRIGKACALLISTEKPIACIADEVGYHNLSHFNRQFYTFKQLTPREFRSTYLKQYRPGANNFLFNEMLLPAGNGQQRQEARLA